jgi:uncharacterized protein YtpQ (UPF0354 family)
MSASAPPAAAAFVSRAIAYLKVVVPDDDPAPVVELSERDSPVLEPYADGLLTAYVVDTGSEYELVQHRHLTAAGVAEEELQRIGLANLGRLVEERPTRVQPYGNMFAVLMGGDFEASLLLVDALWEQSFRQFVRGDYVAAVPARDVLAFCDSSLAAGRVELRRLIDQVYPTGDHVLSSRLYERHDGVWRVQPAC